MLRKVIQAAPQLRTTRKGRGSRGDVHQGGREELEPKAWRWWEVGGGAGPPCSF